MAKNYRVIRLSSTSRASGSNLARYRKEVSKEVRIAHSSWVKDKWRHWLHSKGQISWFIETRYDATQILEILDLEVCFAEETQET